MSEPEDNSGSGFGFWAVIVLVFVIGFFVLAVPNYTRSGSSPANTCINNLRQIDAAKDEWALERNAKLGDVVTTNDIKPYIKLNSYGNISPCPSGGTYFLERIGSMPICSIPGHVLPQWRTNSTQNVPPQDSKLVH